MMIAATLFQKLRASVAVIALFWTVMPLAWAQTTSDDLTLDRVMFATSKRWYVFESKAVDQTSCISGSIPSQSLMRSWLRTKQRTSLTLAASEIPTIWITLRSTPPIGLR